MYQVKLFSARSKNALQEAVNAWLTAYPCQIVNIQLTAIPVEDAIEHIVDYTLVLLIYPMQAV